MCNFFVLISSFLIQCTMYILIYVHHMKPEFKVETATVVYLTAISIKSDKVMLISVKKRAKYFTMNIIVKTKLRAF